MKLEKVLKVVEVIKGYAGDNIEFIVRSGYLRINIKTDFGEFYFLVDPDNPDKPYGFSVGNFSDSNYKTTKELIRRLTK